MALSISYGSQFVSNGATFQPYIVSGIDTGYTLFSVVKPNGWSLTSSGTITAGDQGFLFTVGIGSGTLIFTYTKAGSIDRSIKYDVYVGATRMGEEITIDSKLVYPPPTPRPIPDCNAEDFCLAPDTDCPFVLDVYADANDTTNDLHNDKSDFYYWGNSSISDITLTLQKNASNCGGCTWDDKHTFTFNPDLKANPFGFMGYGYAPNNASYTDDYGKQYVGFVLNWIDVLTAYGEGEYRMQIVYTQTFSDDPIVDYDVRIFCLHQWNCFNIDKTVRIEYITQGFRGDLNDNTIQIDYGMAGWYSQIRLKGIFYETKPNYNKEFNQYGDSDYNSLRPIVHELKPNFTMDIYPVPGWIDWILENNVLLADSILITDYNINNRKKFIKTPVINEGGIDTKDEKFMNPLAWSQILFAYGQNNLRKRNS